MIGRTTGMRQFLLNLIPAPVIPSFSGQICPWFCPGEQRTVTRSRPTSIIDRRPARLLHQDPGTVIIQSICSIPIFSYSNFLAARWIRACHVLQEHFRQRSRRGPEGARVHGARIAGAGKSEDFALPSRKEQRHEKDRTTNDRSLVHHPAGVRVFVQPEQLSHGGRRDGENRDRSGRGGDCQRGPGGAEADQRLRHDRGRKLRERGHRLQRCFRVATEGAGRGERRHRTADLFLVDGGAQLHPAAAGRHGPGGRPAVAGAA